MITCHDHEENQKTSEKVVGLVMGSQSDWETVKQSALTLETLRIGYEARIVSAHRTPERLYTYARHAQKQGLRVLIAAAGGAAHLPGMLAAMTCLPVLGIPIYSHALAGVDSLLSIVQMPTGVPVGTLAIGRSGAINAALLAAAILALNDKDISRALQEYRRRQTAEVSEIPEKVLPKDGNYR